MPECLGDIGCTFLFDNVWFVREEQRLQWCSVGCLVFEYVRFVSEGLCLQWHIVICLSLNIFGLPGKRCVCNMHCSVFVFYVRFVKEEMCCSGTLLYVCL